MMDIVLVPFILAVVFLFGMKAGSEVSWPCRRPHSPSCTRLHVDEDRCGRCRCGANPAMFEERGST